MNELEDLEDILDSIIPEETPSLFSDEKSSLEMVETALLLMEEYIEENPHAVSDPDFHQDFKEEIEELFHIQFENEFWLHESLEEDLEEILDFAFELFFTTFYEGRSIHSSEELKHLSIMSLNNGNNENNNSNRIEALREKIDQLRSRPQPPQRTKEWYEFRYQLITASNAYKAFESQSMINQLIYEKCLPLNTGGNGENTSSTTSAIVPMVNVNSTLHWGQKYEPLSVMLYEEMHQTKVGDFGCIQHDLYKFLGASPDGINVDPLSERFGRMLEIKNIVNREITGIPKKEYWIQMQLQMEVCDLNECDFLETKFTEYPDAASFYSDNSDLQKGIILYFHTKEARPFYVYKPLHITEQSEMEEWEEQMVELYESSQHNNMLFIKHIYWKLDKLSCVLVLRNKKWFESNIGQLQNVWNIIEKERVTGYEHRAPNRRPRSDSKTNSNFVVKQGCLLDLNKITGLPNSNTNTKITVTKLDNDGNDDDIVKNEFTKIIKIRTESIDETKINF
jgi:putative phage-type endonuclease